MNADIHELGLLDVQDAVQYVRASGREVQYVTISKRLFERIIEAVDIPDSHDWGDPTALRISGATLLVVDGPREHIVVTFI